MNRMTSRPRLYVVTGADSGVGKAVSDRLAVGSTVIRCGVGSDVDVRADLTTAEGRAHLVSAVLATSRGRVDGIVAAAGMGAPRPETVSLNFFGVVAVVDGLRDALAASDAPAVAVVSSSSTLNRGSGALVRACLEGDERKARTTARRLIRTGRGSQIYRSSKIALNHWVRSASVSPEFTGAGIVLNAIAPGVLATELVMRTWERERVLLETALPQPLGTPGPVEPVADLLAYAVSPANRFMTGQIVYCDGGTDALVRKARPQNVYLRYTPAEIAAMVRESRRIARAG